MDAVKLANLLAVTNLPGYEVILEIFEEQCVRLEAAVFAVNPTDTAQVITAHRIAVAARWTLDETKKRITNLSSQAARKVSDMTREEQDELYLKSLQ